MDRTLEISEDEQILPVYETLRHHALSTFERGSVGFGAAVLHNKGFLSWAQHAKSFCEGITPRATPSEGCCRIDDELTAVLTDLALRTLTQEEIVC